MTTNPNLDLAREWAQLVGPGAASNIGRAAAEVITALPDEWIDAAKLREVIEGWRTTTNQTMHRVDKTYKSAAADLEALLPTPKPRTLADMTEDEREACRWMKVDVYGVPCEMGVIIYLTEYHATVMWHDGTITTRDHKELTPLPDLPRMVWPDDQATEETPDLPEPEYVKPDPQPGEAWLIEYEGKRYEAVYWYSPLYAHWSFVANREVLKTVESPEATPVSRLVPEKGGVS